jgi:deoxyribodipyrimidine photo-lyase
MVTTGYMNNYLRMLWCKCIIAWTADPREAFRMALTLNDKYFLDGRCVSMSASVYVTLCVCVCVF